MTTFTASGVQRLYFLSHLMRHVSTKWRFYNELRKIFYFKWFARFTRKISRSIIMMRNTKILKFFVVCDRLHFHKYFNSSYLWLFTFILCIFIFTPISTTSNSLFNSQLSASGWKTANSSSEWWNIEWKIKFKFIFYEMAHRCCRRRHRPESECWGKEKIRNIMKMRKTMCASYSLFCHIVHWHLNL